MAATYNNLYLDVRARLKRAGIEAAQLESREILCYASGKTREEFYRDLQLYASTELEEHVYSMVNRRLAGEPLAYLIGEWEFLGLTLDITPDVLIPRPDTEVLAERAIYHLQQMEKESPRVLDLCAGSGCIGLAIASRVPRARVILGEVSEKALQICKQNIRRCGLDHQVQQLAVNALEPPANHLGIFDLLVCNPPYIPTSEIQDLDNSVRDYEPVLALDGGLDGLNFYRYITAFWQPALRRGGTILFEVGIDQALAVKELLARTGFENIRSLEDTAGIPRVVEGTRT